MSKKHYFGGTHAGTSDWKSPKPRCHTTHKPLTFGKGVLFGGSCSSPRSGYDIYIGLDYGMRFDHQKFPWEKNGVDDIIETQYHITDGCAPKSPKKFKQMVTWMCAQLAEGKKIHIGCIGGHGRTGLVIAAVRAEFDGDLNATAWTRKNHCKKAVETQTQIKFLYKHYKIKKLKGSRGDLLDGYSETHTGRRSGKSSIRSNVGKVVSINKIMHVTGKGSIWG